MKAHLIRIGNSKGIRIPKPIIEQCRLAGEVELEVIKDKLVIHSLHRPRKGWEKAFEKMAVSGDDKLLDAESTHPWDQRDWEWK